MIVSAHSSLGASSVGLQAKKAPRRMPLRMKSGGEPLYSYSDGEASLLRELLSLLLS
ncbi:hypothetical protein COLU111180_02125 [Cohnella lubricantis]|nr:hypothetical protein [Cohnella lubricantis]